MTQVLHCAHTPLCESCKEMDCKFNLAHAQVVTAPVRERISECEYVDATQRATAAGQQKSKPRAQGRSMGGTNGKPTKVPEATRGNVIAFIVACIEHVKSTSEYDGMHVKLSGFNAAFRKHFNVDTDTGISLVNDAVENAKSKDGKHPLLYMRGAKGGPIIYLWADKPTATSNGNGELDSKAKGLLAAVTSK